MNPRRRVCKRLEGTPHACGTVFYTDKSRGRKYCTYKCGEIHHKYTTRVVKRRLKKIGGSLGIKAVPIKMRNLGRCRRCFVHMDGNICDLCVI